MSGRSSKCSTQQTDPNFAGTHGGQTFYQFYGTNADQSNAFGKCESGLASAASTAHTYAVVQAAHSCKANGGRIRPLRKGTLEVTAGIQSNERG